MSIRQAVRDLEKRLAGCATIRVFEFPMEERGRIAGSPGLGEPQHYRQMPEMPGRTDMQVLEVWTSTLSFL